MKPHLCDQPMNLTRRACCQLVLFLNDTERKPPIYLVEPVDEAEDHLTFFVGIFMLMIIALAFSIGLSKMTKPKVSISRYNTSNSSYDILMWLSSNPTNRLLPSYQRASQSTSANTPPPPYSATSSLVA
ncbi:hypothetical protein CAEBREN_20194 [Caenorhabditis brenneri]|uniref:Uncharacterized protein n=1 Tax=Caenorhabditis brenneri TaxID=135651 RepID=G0P2Y0_CAEBE|nr:hypothetical protein CAEBREN_20194 [Caenorhabditis brenneri]